MIPRKTLAVLAVLGAAHWATHRHYSTHEEEDAAFHAFVRQEHLKTRARVGAMVSRAEEEEEEEVSVDQLEDLLQALDDLDAVLSTLDDKNEDGAQLLQLWRRGCGVVGRGVARLLSESSKSGGQQDAAHQEQAVRAVLDGPVLRLEELLLRHTTTTSHDDITSLYRSQVALAQAGVRRRRAVQLRKTDAVLRRALPELPMILIATTLSLYAGTLDAARYYLRGEVLTKAIAASVSSSSSAASSSSSMAPLLQRLLALEAVCIVVSIAKERAQSIGKRKFVHNLKTDLFAALIGQDVAYFDRRTADDLLGVRQLVGNADTVCTSLLSAPTSHVESMARIASSLALLYRQSPRLVVALMLGLLPARLVLTGWLERAADAAELHANRALALCFQPSQLAEIWRVLVDPKALKTMRAFAREPAEVRAFSRAIKAKDELDERSAMAYQLLSPVRDALDKLVDIAAVWYGSQFVLASSSSSSVRDLPAFVALCTSTFDQARFLYAALGTFGDDVLDPIERMHDLLESRPAIGLRVPAYEQQQPLASFAIEFSQVHFAYPNNTAREVLRGVSFKVQHGERVGIMGESGCGKSTLFALLERFYDPTQGDIFLGEGVNLKHINPLYLRERIAFVSQQAYMAKRTIRDNLLYGRERDQAGSGCSEEDMHAALRMAQCAFFFEDKQRFPDGLQTDIGTNASKLSGGEVQRLSLARALLAVPPPQLLLLDEYTSALDETSQAKIVDAVQHMWEARKRSSSPLTVLCIAHRLSNFKHVDRVLVLGQQGAVLEQGAPKELMQRVDPPGAFYTFVKTSQIAFEE